MINFSLRNMTDMIFGIGAEDRCGELIQEFGGTRVLLVHTGEPFILDLIKKLRENIEQAGLTSFELPGVVPNPRLELVIEGAELCRKENIDFVLAVGGGSSIDTAKFVAFAAANKDVDLWELCDWREVEEWSWPVLPIGVVSTFAGTGSEMTWGCVISKGKEKGTFDYIGMRPKFCILNPEITTTMPPFQTACGTADIFSHLLEIYFSNTPSDAADNFIKAGLYTVLKHGPIVMDEPQNIESRSALMALAPLPVSKIIRLGRNGDWGAHTIEHVMSGEFDIAHGAGLALVTPVWMRHIYKNNLGLFVKLATEVFGLRMGTDLEATALAAIEATEDFFFHKLKLPRTLRDLGVHANVTEADIQRMNEMIFCHGMETIGDNIPLNREDCYQIFKACCM